MTHRPRMLASSMTMKGAVLAGALAIATLAGAPSSAHAQWWCARHNLNDAEMAICDFPVLRRLDRRMSRLYWSLQRRYRGFPHMRRELRHSQRHWLRRRNSCGYNPPCLVRRYRHRIGVLRYFGV